MRIVDLVDDKIIIKPEALLISPFNEIWASDKDKSKKLATEKIKYIWLFSDFESPFWRSYPEPIRGDMIIRDAIKGFKITKDVEQGIKTYTELYTTAEMRMLDGAGIAVHRMEEYYRKVNFENDDIKKVTDSIIAMPKVIQAIKDARKAAQADKDTGTKIRGNAELGQFE